MKCLEGLPSAPKPKGKQSEFNIYEQNFKQVKVEIYNTLWEVEYYILKAASSAFDFDYMMQKVRIRNLYPYILKAFLEN